MRCFKRKFSINSVFLKMDLDYQLTPNHLVNGDNNWSIDHKRAMGIVKQTKAAGYMISLFTCLYCSLLNCHQTGHVCWLAGGL